MDIIVTALLTKYNYFKQPINMFQMIF